jgi:hypothetical protein
MIGLLFILFTLLYLLFGYFLYGYIRGWGPGKVKSLLITLVILVGVPFGDVIPGKLYLKNLCETQAGIDIRKTIDAPGYYVGDQYFLGCTAACVEKLIKWHELGEEMFVESQVTAPKTEFFANKPGMYRFRLVKRSTDLCAKQDNLMAQYPPYFKKLIDLEKYCIHSENIAEPSAEYRVKEWHWDTNYSRLLGIARVRTLVQKIENGEIVGSNTGFSHKGGWLRRWVSGFMSVGQPDECIDDGDYGFSWSVLRGVFANK